MLAWRKTRSPSPPTSHSATRHAPRGRSGAGLPRYLETTASTAADTLARANEHPAPHTGPAGIDTPSDAPVRPAPSHSGGTPLNPAVRAALEVQLNADFSAVRVHTDASADGLASGFGAQAITFGQDVYFRAGRYDPASELGRALLAHELAHTAQQRRLAAPRIQRQPDAAKPARARPPTAAEARAAAPPQWTDYFDEVVPAILEAAEGNDKVGLQKALWLIIQAYGEQSPGVTGPPSGHRNRLFNEQGAVTREGEKITGVVPGQESEGVYLYNLPQNESPEKGKTDIKTSPTFGYDTPERAASHHLEQMQKRWTPAWGALTQEKGSFEEFAHALKRSGYAKAKTYDTDLIALQNQVRSQVAAWLKYRVPEMRARIPEMEAYLQFLRDTRDQWAQRAADEPDPVGEIKAELARMNGLVKGMESQLADVRARLARLERFAGVLGVKLPAAAA